MSVPVSLEEICNNNIKNMPSQDLYDSFNSFIFDKDIKVLGKLLHRFKFFELTKGCTILGVRENLLDIELEILNYTSEFSLLCYTDGLTDANNNKNENISSLTLQDLIFKNKELSPDDFNKNLIEFAKEFKEENEFPDDIALLTIKVTDLHF